MDLALNNLQRLICHKTQQTKPSSVGSCPTFPSSNPHYKRPSGHCPSSQYSGVLNNVLAWMVSTRPPTSKSSSPFSNPLVTVPKAPITIVTFMFHSFFNSLARSRYLSFFSNSFRFILSGGGGGGKDK